MRQSLLSRRDLLATAAATLQLSAAGSDWVELFNGRNLEGWRAGGHAGSWKVAEGAITAVGAQSHLFYNGPVRGADFRNFELEVEARLDARANSGVYFHTAYQAKGWPEKGFEVQLNNTATGEGGYLERKKTGSLYGIRNVYKQLVADNEWFKIHVLVRGKNIQVRLNGVLLVDYTEPATPVMVPGLESGRFLSHGTFALQCHDAGSRARFRSIRVRPLADDVTAPSAEVPVADDVYRAIIACGARNIPMVDYHVHLKGGLTIGDALQRSRRDGIQYGVALNCGKGFPVENDSGLRSFIEEMKGQPVFLAVQAEGREWVQMVSREAVALFDYVFTDSMTWTDNRGRRMRTWVREELGTITDEQEFMDTLVDRAAGILENEPIDIYVNPTFLPAPIAKDYDRLWTERRMQRVVDAAAGNHVAIEINDRFKLPSVAFVRMAKAAGCKFTFGTNNGGAQDLGRSEYGLKMVEQCQLTWRDFFVPGAWWPKAVERKGGVLRG